MRKVARYKPRDPQVRWRRGTSLVSCLMQLLMYFLKREKTSFYTATITPHRKSDYWIDQLVTREF